LAIGGSSMIQGHAAIVLTLPLLFLMTVIFIGVPRKNLGFRPESGARQFLAMGGSSMIQGHAAIVLTLPFDFLMIVTFIGDS
jgi:hypothetical protein